MQFLIETVSMRTKTVEIAAVSFRGDLLPKEKMDIESDCIIAFRF